MQNEMSLIIDRNKLLLWEEKSSIPPTNTRVFLINYLNYFVLNLFLAFPKHLNLNYQLNLLQSDDVLVMSLKL